MHALTIAAIGKPNRERRGQSPDLRRSDRPTTVVRCQMLDPLRRIDDAIRQRWSYVNENDPGCIRALDDHGVESSLRGTHLCVPRASQPFYEWPPFDEAPLHPRNTRRGECLTRIQPTLPASHESRPRCLVSDEGPSDLRPSAKQLRLSVSLDPIACPLGLRGNRTSRTRR